MRKEGSSYFFSTCSSSYPRWVQHVWKGHTWAGEPAIWTESGTPNCKQTSGEMPQVSRQGEGEKGRVQNSQSFSENNKIHRFPYIFHLKKNQKQTCCQEKEALARFQMLIARFTSTAVLHLLLGRKEWSLIPLKSLPLQAESCRVRVGRIESDHWTLDFAKTGMSQ